jgi:opacity protein-like surface antigen
MRKTVLFLIAFLVLAAAFAAAQPVPGKRFELGGSFALASVSFGGEDSMTVLHLPVRFGFFVWKGLELEPELMLQALFMDEGSRASYNLSANVAYNFGASKPLIPFVLAGLGAGNAIAVGPGMERTGGGSVTLMNLGGGVKYMLGKLVAVRIEYRFTHNWVTKGVSSGYANTHLLMAGFGIFF